MGIHGDDNGDSRGVGCHAATMLPPGGKRRHRCRLDSVQGGHHGHTARLVRPPLADGQNRWCSEWAEKHGGDVPSHCGARAAALACVWCGLSTTLEGVDGRGLPTSGQRRTAQCQAVSVCGPKGRSQGHWMGGRAAAWPTEGMACVGRRRKVRWWREEGTQGPILSETTTTTPPMPWKPLHRTASHHPRRSRPPCRTAEGPSARLGCMSIVVATGTPSRRQPCAQSQALQSIRRRECMPLAR